MGKKKEHDFVDKSWGHNVSISRIIDGGKKMKVFGWCRGIKEGDILYLRNYDDGVWFSAYEVVEIDYYRNPSDMFSAKLKWKEMEIKEKEKVYDKYKWDFDKIDKRLGVA